MTLEQYKSELIQEITESEQLEFVLAIRRFMARFQRSTDRLPPPIPFERGITTIRSGIDKEQLFREAGNKQPTYAEWRAKTANIEWNHSLEEALALLD